MGDCFTMEATDLNVSADLDQASGASPMDKVVEIMSDVSTHLESQKRWCVKRGPAIEVQIPDLPPSRTLALLMSSKPAKLNFVSLIPTAKHQYPFRRGNNGPTKKVFLMLLCFGAMHNPMNAQFGYVVCGLLTGKLLPKHTQGRIKWVDGK